MTISELCCLLRNMEQQEVIIYDYHSEDYDIIFKGSAYNAIMSDFAYCEIVNYELRSYDCRNVLAIYIVK